MDVHYLDDTYSYQTSQLSLFGSETQYFEHNLNTSIPFLNILLQFLTDIFITKEAHRFHFLTG